MMIRFDLILIFSFKANIQEQKKANDSLTFNRKTKKKRPQQQDSAWISRTGTGGGLPKQNERVLDRIGTGLPLP